jgi:hypothetical protein
MKLRSHRDPFFESLSATNPGVTANHNPSFNQALAIPVSRIIVEII